MEAKDTVKKENIEASVFCIGFTGDANEWSACTFWEMATQLALDQAEISFKAGVEQGRREVINAIDNYKGSYMDRRFLASVYWLKKCKEWGIE